MHHGVAGRSANPTIAAPRTDIMEFEEDAMRVLSVLLGGQILQGGALAMVCCQVCDLVKAHVLAFASSPPPLDNAIVD